MSKMKEKLAASVRHARDAQATAPKATAKPAVKPAAKPVAKPAAKPAPAKSAQAANTHAGGIADSRNQLFPARVWPD